LTVPCSWFLSWLPPLPGVGQSRRALPVPRGTVPFVAHGLRHPPLCLQAYPVGSPRLLSGCCGQSTSKVCSVSVIRGKRIFMFSIRLNIVRMDKETIVKRITDWRPVSVRRISRPTSRG